MASLEEDEDRDLAGELVPATGDGPSTKGQLLILSPH